MPRNIFPENLSVSAWIAIGMVGGNFILAQEVLNPALTLNYTFLGGLLVCSTVVGLSTNLSAATHNPRFNLWRKLLSFASKHKFAFSCLGLGILMLNPLVAVGGTGFGFLMEKILPKTMKHGDKIVTGLWQAAQERSFSDHLVYLEENLKNYINHNPGKSTTFLLGLLSGLGLFSLGFPWFNTATSAINEFNAGILDYLSQWVAHSFDGGTILSLLLKGLSIASNMAVTFAPALALTSSCIWILEQSRLLAKRALLFIGQKIKQQAQKARQFIGKQWQRIYPPIAKIGRTIKNVYQTGVSVVRFLSQPLSWFKQKKSMAPLLENNQSEANLSKISDKPENSSNEDSVERSDSSVEISELKNSLEVLLEAAPEEKSSVEAKEKLPPTKYDEAHSLSEGISQVESVSADNFAEKSVLEKPVENEKTVSLQLASTEQTPKVTKITSCEPTSQDEKASLLEKMSEPEKESESDETPLLEKTETLTPGFIQAQAQAQAQANKVRKQITAKLDAKDKNTIHLSKTDISP